MDENGNYKCGGACSYTENNPNVMVVFADDSSTPEKEGFAWGETIHYKTFSWSIAGGTTFDVDSVFTKPTNNQLCIKVFQSCNVPITKMVCWTDFDCQIASTNPEKHNLKLTFLKD